MAISSVRNIAREEGVSFELCAPLGLKKLAWRNWSQNTPLDIVDPMIITTSSNLEITRYIHIGLFCVQESVANRPTMSSDLRFDLQAPSQAALAFDC